MKKTAIIPIAKIIVKMTVRTIQLQAAGITPAMEKSEVQAEPEATAAL